MTGPNWKNIALYLADCHAATAEYDGLLKSCSNSRRDRFASICDKTLALLDCRDVPYDMEGRRVKDRLAGALMRLKVGS